MKRVDFNEKYSSDEIREIKEIFKRRREESNSFCAEELQRKRFMIENPIVTNEWQKTLDGLEELRIVYENSEKYRKELEIEFLNEVVEKEEEKIILEKIEKVILELKEYLNKNQNSFKEIDWLNECCKKMYYLKKNSVVIK